jgi:hypothetical protein
VLQPPRLWARQDQLECTGKRRKFISTPRVSLARGLQQTTSDAGQDEITASMSTASSAVPTCLMKDLPPGVLE